MTEAILHHLISNLPKTGLQGLQLFMWQSVSWGLSRNAIDDLLDWCPNLETLKIGLMFKLKKEIRLGLANMAVKIIEQCPKTLRNLDFGKFSYTDTNNLGEGKLIMTALCENMPVRGLDELNLRGNSSWWKTEYTVDLLC